MRPDRATLEALFENAPRFVERLTGGDYASWDQVLTHGEQLARTLPEDERLELVDGHPRIGALPSSVSANSYREQGYDRDPGTAALQARLDRLNAEYEARMGFRFVIFVNGRSHADVADLIERHLDEPRDTELARALDDVFAIARRRLVDQGNETSK